MNVRIVGDVLNVQSEGLCAVTSLAASVYKRHLWPTNFHIFSFKHPVTSGRSPWPGILMLICPEELKHCWNIMFSMIPFSTNNHTDNIYLSGSTTIYLEYDMQLKVCVRPSSLSLLRAPGPLAISFFCFLELISSLHFRIYFLPVKNHTGFFQTHPSLLGLHP